MARTADASACQSARGDVTLLFTTPHTSESHADLASRPPGPTRSNSGSMARLTPARHPPRGHPPAVSIRSLHVVHCRCENESASRRGWARGTTPLRRLQKRSSPFASAMWWTPFTRSWSSSSTRRSDGWCVPPAAKTTTSRTSSRRPALCPAPFPDPPAPAQSPSIWIGFAAAARARARKRTTWTRSWRR